MVVTTLTYRRFFININQWRVGLSGATHSYCDKKSGFVSVEWEEVDPYVKIIIPGAANAVYQLINNPDIVGKIILSDYNAIYQLLYNTDVLAAGGSQYAVTATSRNIIDYFVVTIDHAKITVATEARASAVTTFTFTNARIGRIFKQHSDPKSPWVVEFYADSVAESDA